MLHRIGWLAVALLAVVGVALGANAELTVAQNSGKPPTTPPASPAVLPSAHPGKIWTEPTTGMEFVWVPDGCFAMGSRNGEEDEQPVHRVCLDGFWIGRCEVSQAEWQQVMGYNPSRFRDDRNPVEKVSWDEAQEFVNRLNAEGGAFRLPTEAEWEYAARFGGEDQKYAGSDDADRVAWYDATSGGKTHRAGAKEPNGLGLHDMSGNVGEWCMNTYNASAYSRYRGENSPHQEIGPYRVTRGGSWNDEAMFVRVTARSMAEPDFPSDMVGLRLVRAR